MASNNSKQNEKIPNKRSGMRKATFCFVVACLFGNSSSLSSPLYNRMGPKSLPDDLLEEGLNLANTQLSKKNQAKTTQEQVKSRPSYNIDATDPSNRPRISALSSVLTSSTLPGSFRQVRNKVIEQLREDNDLDHAKIIIFDMIEYLKENSVYVNEKNVTTTATTGNSVYPYDQKQYLSPQDQRDISEVIDETLQAFFARAFKPVVLNNESVNRGQHKKQDGWHRVALGIELLQLQLGSSDVLVHPYHDIPKRVLVQALAAVTRLQEQEQRQYQYNRLGTNDEAATIHSDTAFRLLQRLVTGFGVRNSHRSKHFENLEKNRSSGRGRSNQSTKPAPLYEVDFNRVLNIYSSSGKMDMAHRVIALQERTPHAPALSPVTYSILVKGYGKLCDADNIDMLLRHAVATTDENQKIMKPDTILFNSLMDAYINCCQLNKAQTILTAMVANNRSIMAAIDLNMPERNPKSSETEFFTFAPNVCPSPNLRSYNILLKGYAQQGLLQEALELTEEMKAIGSFRGDERYWWDHVTTNTLVQAAVIAKEFETAKDILDQHTLLEHKSKNEGPRRRRRRDHPNADAYTTLMDGYAKDGQLKQAIGLLTTMKTRKVEPNEYHYSCLIGSLAREKKIFHAESMLAHVRSTGIITRTHQKAIYNAFISGLVQRNQDTADDHDRHVDKAIMILKNMIEERIMPDANTVAIILDGFGHCNRPRMKEAITLVEKLETQRIIPTNHIRVTTALVRVCASCHNLDGAITCFRRIPRPDVAAINALIDAAVRSGNNKVAIESFDRYFNGDIPRAVPDVVTFSTLIGAYMKKGSFDGSRQARELYQDMRFQRRILPDKGLVDIIVKGMIESCRTCGVQASDARFVAGVLRDAEKLDWGEGQLDQRKRAIDSAMSKHVANAWEEEAELYGLWKNDGTTRKLRQKDNLFQRHGWNEVDSGFRLWGPGKKNEDAADDFLQSKGWNDIDSGFRVFF